MNFKRYLLSIVRNKTDNVCKDITNNTILSLVSLFIYVLLCSYHNPELMPSLDSTYASVNFLVTMIKYLTKVS